MQELFALERSGCEVSGLSPSCCSVREHEFLVIVGGQIDGAVLRSAVEVFLVMGVVDSEAQAGTVKEVTVKACVERVSARCLRHTWGLRRKLTGGASNVIYITEFEAPFLRLSATAYRACREKWLEECSLLEYVNEVSFDSSSVVSLTQQIVGRRTNVGRVATSRRVSGTLATWRDGWPRYFTRVCCVRAPVISQRVRSRNCVA